MEFKKCGGKHGCGETKPITEFYLNKGRPNCYCKDCDKTRAHNWDTSNRARRNCRVWIIPGEIVRDNMAIGIGANGSKWDKYEHPIDKISTVCATKKQGNMREAGI
jgi:hypothetical protein